MRAEGRLLMLLALDAPGIALKPLPLHGGEVGVGLCKDGKSNTAPEDSQ